MRISQAMEQLEREMGTLLRTVPREKVRTLTGVGRQKGYWLTWVPDFCGCILWKVAREDALSLSRGHTDGVMEAEPVVLRWSSEIMPLLAALTVEQEIVWTHGRADPDPEFLDVCWQAIANAGCIDVAIGETIQ